MFLSAVRSPIPQKSAPTLIANRQRVRLVAVHMASFKERFKDKSSVVGKDGKNAMLAPQQQQHHMSPPYQQSPAGQQQPASYAQLHHEGTSGSFSGAANWGSSPPISQPSGPAPGNGPAPTSNKPPLQWPPQQRAQDGKPKQPSTQVQPPGATGVASAKAPLQFPPRTNSIVHDEPAVPFAHPQPQGQPQVSSKVFPPPAQPLPPAKAGSFAFAGGFQPTGIMPAPSVKQPVAQEKPVISNATNANTNHGNGVGTYNYAAAAAPAPVSGPTKQDRNNRDGRSPTKRGVDGGIRFGRRAGSSDGIQVGAGAPKRDLSRNRHQSDDRPQTDPSKDGNDVSPSRREVHYTPYSVDDYRRMKEEVAKKQSGGLGPSDTDEQRAAAQRLQRQREYAENIKRVNRIILGNPPHSQSPSGELGVDGAVDGVSPRPSRAPIVQPTPSEVIEKQRMRERANEYAKKVPKPKQKVIPAQDGANSGEVDHKEDLWGAGEAETKKQENERKIADLEARHAQDQQMVANLKKQLRI